MRVLLDTNIVIHREAAKVVNEEIGVLFRWLDNLRYGKFVHPETVKEFQKLAPGNTHDTFQIKLEAYNVIKVCSPIADRVKAVCDRIDTSGNDRIDTLLINEVFNQRVDALISEDKKIAYKAQQLGIADKVFTIEGFLERVTSQNPGLADYRVLSVKKAYFGHIAVNDDFFDSFRDDYPGFNSWFNRKSDETAYICKSDESITAFLYLKVEDEQEPYPEISPAFARKKRLKIGTFKVALNGYRLGERFLKIVFDNAIRLRVDEIYVTIFNRRADQQRLVALLEEFGFVRYGVKRNVYGDEDVYVRDIRRKVDLTQPKVTFPYFSNNTRAFIVPIYQEYHTSLFPDSILKNESPDNFIEHEPFRNAISKVYISRSYFRDLKTGDVLLFYRTGGYYKGVVTTVGIVENAITLIKDHKHFLHLCGKRSVFSDQELIQHWNYSRQNRPFIVNFLYAYSLPKRPNLKRLIELGVIKDINSVPRGFERIRNDHLKLILREAQANESFVVD